MITPPDIFILIILIFFSVSGIKNGFIKEISRVLSFIIGFLISGKYYYYLNPYLKPYIKNESMLSALSYLIIFFVLLYVLSLISKLVQKLFEFVLLGWLNRVLGLLLGLLKGFFIVSLIIFTIETIPFKLEQGESIKQKLEKESIMYQICNHVKEMLILNIPSSDDLDQVIKIIDIPN
tara:strand:+ start:779 stop:1312 length:534 start_codon:yes stop_codon:yes gene_type:complete